MYAGGGGSAARDAAPPASALSQQGLDAGHTADGTRRLMYSLPGGGAPITAKALPQSEAHARLVAGMGDVTERAGPGARLPRHLRPGGKRMVVTRD